MGNLLPTESTFAGIWMRGPDSADFGGRMFSRDLKTLAVGDGALSLFLTAEGRISEIFWVVRNTETELLLLTPKSRREKLKALIEKFHFSEKFSLSNHDPAPLKSEWMPSSSAGQGFGKLDTAKTVFTGYWRSTEFRVDLRAGAPGADLGKTAWNLHRIHNLIPEIGFDFESERALVFDLSLEELCDENKGCYIGQEVVERIRTRGGGAGALKTLVALKFSVKMETPVAGEEVMTKDGAPVGNLLSTIQLEEGLALASIKKGAATDARENRIELKLSKSNLSAKIV